MVETCLTRVRTIEGALDAEQARGGVMPETRVYVVGVMMSDIVTTSEGVKRSERRSKMNEQVRRTRV